MKNKLVVFEGLDGTGKSTQAKLLAKARGALYTKQPGGYKNGQDLKGILLNRNSQLSDFSEAMLFTADRSIHTEKVLLPALESGQDVVCDRYVGSFLAYQGYGRRGDIDFLTEISKRAIKGLEPDLVILLKSTKKLPLASEIDRIEKEGEEFHKRVMDGYMQLLEKHSASWRLIDAGGGKEEVAQKINSLVASEIGWEL